MWASLAGYGNPGIFDRSNTLVVREAGFGTVAEGPGFAVPVSTARAVAEQIIAKGYFSRPYLGIRWQLITPNVARAYYLPVAWAVYVTDVVADGPARQACDRVTLEVVRDGNTIQVQVILGETNPS